MAAAKAGRYFGGMDSKLKATAGPSLLSDRMPSCGPGGSVRNTSASYNPERSCRYRYQYTQGCSSSSNGQCWIPDSFSSTYSRPASTSVPVISFVISEVKV